MGNMDQRVGQVSSTSVSMAMEMAIEMIFTLDTEGRILSCNRSAMEELGYGDEVTGLPASDVFSAEGTQEKDSFSFDYASVIKKSGSADTQHCLELKDWLAYRKNATCFPVFLRMVPDEKEKRVCLMAMNITSSRALEKELIFLKSETAEALRMRDEFIANVTHELRTPVNGVKGHTSALLAACPAAELRPALDIILRCCEDMTSLINNILDFSKLEAGKFQLNEIRFDLYEMLEHVIATNVAVANEKELRITLHISENVPRFVYGDDLRLTQILNNLISNGVKFTDIGMISVDVAKHRQYGEEIELFFIVRDTGIGIAPQDRERIFKSFSQVDASSTRKYGGTGLGLVITRELVELMGGSIQLESQKGKGSNFSFTVRLKTTEADNNRKYVSRFLNPYDAIGQPEGLELVYQFGAKENADEIKRKTETLILALELEAWEKAEVIAAGLKKLLETGPEDLKRELFRLELSIRKEDVEKSRVQYEKLTDKLKGVMGGFE